MNSATPVGELMKSYIVVIILPLVPIGLQFWMAGKPTDEILSVTAIIFSITIGVSSRWNAVLLFGILISIIFASSFGFLIASQALPIYCRESSGACISIISFTHMVERYHRHIQLKEQFV